jgi:hypothetical protein
MAEGDKQKIYPTKSELKEGLKEIAKAVKKEFKELREQK